MKLRELIDILTTSYVLDGDKEIAIKGEGLVYWTVDDAVINSTEDSTTAFIEFIEESGIRKTKGKE